MECPICLEACDTTSRVPMISTVCGHGVCSVCSEELAGACCPECRLPLDKYVKNFAALKMIEEAVAAAALRAAQQTQQEQRMRMQQRQNSGTAAPACQVDLTRLRFTASPLNEIGSGSFGTVYHGYMDNQAVAIKLVHTLGGAASSAVLQIQREVDRYSRLRSPHVVHFYGTSLDDQGRILIITELMHGGSLRMALDEFQRCSNQRLPAACCLRIASQIARGLAYLHGAGFSHGDVKSGNVLLSDLLSPGGYNVATLRAKLADFGLSLDLTKLASGAPATVASGTSSEAAGTWAYLAPEQFDSSRQSDAQAKAADVFAFGILMYELISTRVPWKGIGLPELYVKVCVHGQRPGNPHVAVDAIPGLTNSLATLVDSCWQQKPENRPSMVTVSELLEQWEAEAARVQDPGEPQSMPEITKIPLNNAAATSRLYSSSQDVLPPRSLSGNVPVSTAPHNVVSPPQSSPSMSSGTRSRSQSNAVGLAAPAPAAAAATMTVLTPPMAQSRSLSGAAIATLPGRSTSTSNGHVDVDQRRASAGPSVRRAQEIAALSPEMIRNMSLDALLALVTTEQLPPVLAHTAVVSVRGIMSSSANKKTNNSKRISRAGSNRRLEDDLDRNALVAHLLSVGFLDMLWKNVLMPGSGMVTLCIDALDLCYLIVKEASDQDKAAFISVSGRAQELVQLMATHAGQVRVQISACSLMRTLVRANERVITLMVGACALEAVLRAMYLHKDSASLYSHALPSITYLVRGNGPAAARFGSIEGIPWVVYAKTHALDQAYICLCALLCDDSNAERTAKAIGGALLIEGLNSMDREMKSGLEAVSRLCNTAGSVRDLIRFDVGTALERILTKYRANGDVQRSCMRTIVCLARMLLEARLHLGACGCVESLVKSMEYHLKVSSIQEVACEAMRWLSSDKDTAMRLKNTKALKLAQAAAKRFPGNAVKVHVDVLHQNLNKRW
ncbi:Serine/threonine-protein kinase HT1 [Porphyridium purpureum]|uniref:Serine/threonine-protein kinase HT1 n=1 Tax=Porphyridium purpureum TaxID=35688 RepID=A0A5J4YPH5_PORPP|nr:Serine/threonine-protein kinase HT1 [Porphyridium purpureum]|eukprot:POR3108..scf295_9